MEQTDLILLVLTGLSVLIGFSRGFSYEIMRLFIYVFSGVLGYALIPLFQPAFSFIPFEPAQKTAAVCLGTMISWIVLKIVLSSIVKEIRNSRFSGLDRSLGMVFGAVRAFVFLIILCLIFSFAAPEKIRESKILTYSHAGASKLFEAFPEIQTVQANAEKAMEEGKGAVQLKAEQGINWKERVLAYLQNTTVDTPEGKKKLLSSVASVMARSMMKTSSSQGDIPPEMKEALSSSETEKVFAETIEKHLSSWLDGEVSSQSEMGENIRNELQDKLQKQMMDIMLKKEAAE